MKQILVLSDSHGNRSGLKRILKAYKNADKTVFLGDGLSDMEDCIGDGSSEVIMVKGNCDATLATPLFKTFTLGGHRFLCLHGYYPNAKIGLDGLADVAQENDCDIVLYGHTHTPLLSTLGEATLFNPGAVVSGSFGVLTINEDTKEITFSHQNL